MKKCVIFVVVFLFILMPIICLFGDDGIDDVASGIWMDAYGLCEKAKDCYSQKDYNSSLAFYENALKLFQTLSEKYPDWNKSLVQYRITHCKELIVVIEDKIIAVDNNKSRKELAKENLSLQTKNANIESLLIAEQRKLKAAIEALEKSQKELVKNSAAAGNLKNLLEEKTKLEREKELLSSEVDELRKNNENSQTLKESMSQLEEYRLNLNLTQKEKQILQGENDKLKRQYQKLSFEKKQAIGEENTKQRDLTEFKNQLSESQNRIDSLNSKVFQLQTEKDYLNGNLKELRERLEEERSNSTFLQSDLKEKSGDQNQKLIRLLDENAKIKKALVKNQEEVDNLIKLKESYEIDLNNLRSKYDQISSTLANVNKKRIAIENEANILRQKIVEKVQKESEDSQKIESLKEALNKAQKDYDLLANQYRGMEEKVLAFNELLSNDRKLANTNEELNKFTTDLQVRMKIMFAKIQNENNNLRHQLSEANMKISNLEQERSQNLGQIQDLLKQLQEQPKTISSNVEAEKQFIEAERKITDYETIQKEQNKKIDELIDKIEFLEDKIEMSNREKDRLGRKSSGLGREIVGENLIYQPQINDTASQIEIIGRSDIETKQYSSLLGKFKALNRYKREIEDVRNKQDEKIKQLSAEIKNLKENAAQFDSAQKNDNKKQPTSKITPGLIRVDLNEEIVSRLKNLMYDLETTQKRANKLESKAYNLETQFTFAEKKIIELETERDQLRLKIQELLEKLKIVKENNGTPDERVLKLEKDLVAANIKIAQLESEQSIYLKKMTEEQAKSETKLKPNP